MIVTVPTARRGPAKSLEQERCARARSTALAALAPLLTGLQGQDRDRMADAALDVAMDLHSAVHEPSVTAPRVNAWAGRNYPYTAPGKAKAEAEARAVFKRSAA